jgi:putative photosynthetic complex assembly protein 2
MQGYAPTILFTLFLWWCGTGIILYLDSLARHTYRWSMLGASIALLWTLGVMADSALQTSVAAAYKAFACGIVCWGWVEMSFLMGLITGPRRSPCPADSTGWSRAGFAFEAILHHELALLAIGLTIAYLTLEAPNRLSLYTYTVLWLLRQSAKLNVFLGVPNLSEELLPEHLRYLQTYFTRRRMNLLFPVSITAATVCAALLWLDAARAGAGTFELTQACFLASLTTLGLLEHWFLVLPIPVNVIWTWRSEARQNRARTEISDFPGNKKGRSDSSANLAAAREVASEVPAK